MRAGCVRPRTRAGAGPLTADVRGGAGQVIAGGGDGTIVGGTGRFSKWTGTYTDRVFVEFSFTGGANYYDQLFFSISKS
jgi:hypothetical protein